MLEVYIDGASAGSPGVSGIGIFIKGEGHLLKISETIEPTNNHIAEFKALLRGLQQAKVLNSSFIWLHSDSKIVIDSLEKRYVKSEDYKPFLEDALSIIDSFELFYAKWVPSKDNRAADALAKEAIQKQLR